MLPAASWMSSLWNWHTGHPPTQSLCEPQTAAASCVSCPGCWERREMAKHRSWLAPWPYWHCLTRCLSKCRPLAVHELALSLINNHHLHFLTDVPCKPELAGSLTFFFLHLFQKGAFGTSVTRSSWAVCPLCHPINSVKALKGKRKNSHHQMA